MNTQNSVSEWIVLTSRETVFGGPETLLRGCLVRRCLLPVICVVLSAVGGCMVIPLPEHGLHGGRGKIDKADLTFLKVSTTTREDVLLRFGEPDVVLYDQRVLAYRWEVNVGYWFVFSEHSGSGDSINKTYLLMLEFDEQGCLKRFQTKSSLWSMSRRTVEEWARAGSKKPS
jgi:hypothetical protein